MNKIFKIILIVSSLCLISCGKMSVRYKTMQSNVTLLKREITVYSSETGKIVWNFKGDCFMTEESKTGDITIIFDNKGIKKADFIGDRFFVIMVEKD